jgi:hypothetical protein
MEVDMTRFEKKLLDYINEIFQEEIKNNIVELEINTPEYAMEQGHSFKGWAIGIRKHRKKLQDVRIVIESPDIAIMNEVDDYRTILRTMAEKAKHILNDPPSEQYISQGTIRTASEGNHAEFISKSKLRELK